MLAGREALGGAALVSAAAVKVIGGRVALRSRSLGSPRRSRLLAGRARRGRADRDRDAGRVRRRGGRGARARGRQPGQDELLERPEHVSRLTGIDVDPVRFVLSSPAFAALVVWLLVWTARGGDWVRAAGLGRLRPARRDGLARSLVRDLGAPARRRGARPLARRRHARAVGLPASERGPRMSGVRAAIDEPLRPEFDLIGGWPSAARRASAVADRVAWGSATTRR